MPILQGDQKYLCQAINCLHCKLNTHITCTNEKFDTIYSSICFGENIVTIKKNVEITGELQGTTGTFSNKLTTNELCATSGNFTDKVNIQELCVTGTTNLIGELQGTTGTFTKVITDELCATNGNFDTVDTKNIFNVEQIYSLNDMENDPGIQFFSYGGVRFNSDVSVDKKLTTDQLCATSGTIGELQGTTGTFSNKLTTDQLCATSGNFTDKVNIQELCVTGTTNLLDELQGTTGTFTNKLTTNQLCVTGSSGTISIEGAIIENVDDNIIYRKTEGSTGIGIAGPCVKAYKTFTPTGGVDYINLYEDGNVSFYWDNNNKQPCYVLHKTPSGSTGSINDYVSVSTNVISNYTNEPHAWVGTNETGMTGYFGWISLPTTPNPIYEHSFYGSRTEAMLSSFSNYLDYPLYKLTVKTGNVNFSLPGATGSGFTIIEVFNNF